MPARRRKRKVKKKAGLKVTRIVVASVLFIVVLVLTNFFVLRKKFWDGKSKLSIVINDDEHLLVSTFDPTLGEITNIHIPLNIEVDVSRDLGIWKVESLWQLSENENLKGKLVAETLVKHFQFPVFVWAETPARNLASKNLLLFATSVFGNYDTNLSFGDRIAISFFSFKLNNLNKTDIFLVDTNFIKKTEFSDGGDGYELSGFSSNSIRSVFSDSMFENFGSAILIKDQTGTYYMAEDVGKNLEVLGAKVAYVEKDEKNPIDCLVRGDDEEIVKRIALVFSCQIDEKKMGGNFDAEFVMGSEFARRF